MELADGSIERDISVLLVHVVVSGSGLISQDNSEGLDMVGSSLEDFVDGQDLPLSSFGLELSAEMVPEFGFSNDFVGGEQTDGIYFWVGVLISGDFAAEDEILSSLRLLEMSTFIWREGSAGS